MPWARAMIAASSPSTDRSVLSGKLCTWMSMAPLRTRAVALPSPAVGEEPRCPARTPDTAPYRTAAAAVHARSLRVWLGADSTFVMGFRAPGDRTLTRRIEAVPDPGL